MNFLPRSDVALGDMRASKDGSAAKKEQTKGDGAKQLKKPRLESQEEETKEFMDDEAAAQVATSSTMCEEDAVDFTLRQVFEHAQASKTQLVLSLRKLGLECDESSDLAAGAALERDDSICTFASFRTLARPALCRAAAKACTWAGDGVQVFLGGACNPTTWRKDEAIPLLEAAGITFYNPQVDEWSPELVDVEARMKASAQTLLFVVAAQTRSISSMIEAAEHIARQRNVVLVIEELDAGLFHPDEVKDLQRGRAYLTDVAKRHGLTVYSSTSKAHIVLRMVLQTSYPSLLEE
ncbi:Hypothetical Protein FCC1311_035192 [Hondaea fermentalgiana]|uniref:Uncharacterized protein n=1 Tax=Hondaea fermentalgiana TaxID=2315210 RepID=A0A2R5G8C3_9STRA|nr:Hypothetical Protein FCC1311_035192 [Hondaea fermentalgiana]|eukprot:GBG27297.1 Hypothetical Protein FCC1311_035192 [Hondaea fermentalgiana]